MGELGGADTPFFECRCNGGAWRGGGFLLCSCLGLLSFLSRIFWKRLSWRHLHFDNVGISQSLMFLSSFGHHMPFPSLLKIIDRRCGSHSPCHTGIPSITGFGDSFTTSKRFNQLTFHHMSYFATIRKRYWGSCRTIFRFDGSPIDVR